MKTKNFKPTAESVEHIWAYLLGYIEDNKISPTLEEIAWHLKSKTDYKVSKERIRQLLKVLVGHGKIRVYRGIWRGIHIIEKNYGNGQVKGDV